MNLAQLEHKLITAARLRSPGDGVPFAFEKRVMARLAGRPGWDLTAYWAHALWRAAAPCVAIMVLLCAWSMLSPSASNPDFSQQFANTVLAGVDQEGVSN